MRRIEDRIRIERPVADVWRVLADFGAVFKFNPIVKSSALVGEQSEGVGTVRQCEMVPMGSIRETVTAWRDEELLVFRFHDAHNLPPFADAQGSFSLSAEGQATWVTLAVEYRGRPGLGGRLADVLMLRPRFRRAVPGMLAGLKKYCEQASAPTDGQRERPAIPQRPEPQRHGTSADGALSIDSRAAACASEEYSRLMLDPTQRQIVEELAAVVAEKTGMGELSSRGFMWRSLRRWQEKHHAPAWSLLQMTAAQRRDAVVELAEIYCSIVSPLLAEGKQRERLAMAAEEALKLYLRKYVDRPVKPSRADLTQQAIPADRAHERHGR